MRQWKYGLVAVLFATAPAFGQDADPKAIVKKAIEAHGGADVLNKYRAGEYEIKGRMAVAGGETDFTGKVVYQLPDKYKMALDLDVGGAKLTLTQIANGKDVTITLNGNEQAASKEVKAEAVQAAAIQEITQLTPLLEGTKYTLKADKDSEVNGAKASAVTASAEGIKDITLYFDQATGRLVRTTRQGLSPEEKTVTEEASMSDFKNVSGMLIPMSVEVTHDGKKFMTVEISAAKVMESTDAKQFEKK